MILLVIHFATVNALLTFSSIESKAGDLAFILPIHSQTFAAPHFGDLLAIASHSCFTLPSPSPPRSPCLPSRPHLCSPILSPEHPPVSLLDRPDRSSMRLTKLRRSQRRLCRMQLCCILQAAQLALQQQTLPLLFL